MNPKDLPKYMATLEIINKKERVKLYDLPFRSFFILNDKIYIKRTEDKCICIQDGDQISLYDSTEVTPATNVKIICDIK